MSDILKHSNKSNHRMFMR